jgi:hypothetical protein
MSEAELMLVLSEAQQRLRDALESLHRSLDEADAREPTQEGREA